MEQCEWFIVLAPWPIIYCHSFDRVNFVQMRAVAIQIFFFLLFSLLTLKSSTYFFFRMPFPCSMLIRRKQFSIHFVLCLFIASFSIVYTLMYFFLCVFFSSAHSFSFVYVCYHAKDLTAPKKMNIRRKHCGVVWYKYKYRLFREICLNKVMSTEKKYANNPLWLYVFHIVC